MNTISKIIRSLVGILVIVSFGSFLPDDGWTSLLDKNLSQWDMYLGFRLKPGYNGEVPTNEKGEPLSPIGYHNDSNVFSMLEEKGEPVLRISGEIYGCVFTKKDYENYHLKLKVKWGEKKWDPRKDKLKDSGLMYNSQGPAGAGFWRAWMLAQEFQIMEGHMGDYWSVVNSAIDIRAINPEGPIPAIASDRHPFLPLGPGTPLEGFCLRSADYESPMGEWTTLELISFGDKSLHIVNGHVVMILRNSRFVKDGQAFPLVKGKIQLQSEAAELFFKDIQIKNISAMPKEYARYF